MSNTPAEPREPQPLQPGQAQPESPAEGPADTRPTAPGEPADTLPEPAPELVAVDRPVGADVPASEPLPDRLSLDEVEPAAPQATDLSAVDAPGRTPGQGTNLDLPGFELPYPAPEPVHAAPPAASAPSFGPGATGTYAENMAQASYGQPTPQPSPAPYAQPTPPYAQPSPPPYAEPQGYGQQQYSQPGFGQQYGGQQYGQQQYGQLVPSGQLSATDENTWATAAHWSSLVGGLVSLPFLGPLLVMLIQGPKSPRVRANAVESLNFDITMIIAFVVSLILTVVIIGALLMPVIGIAWLVFKIIAAVQTTNGRDYRYPLNIRLVK